MRVVFLAAVVWSSFANCCTDFVVKARDGTLVNGRSLEFGTPLPAQVRVFARGDRVQSGAPDGSGGVGWTAKYGFVGATSLQDDCVVDGLNEAGLGFGALWLPGTQYQSVSAEEGDRALDFVHLGIWALGQFASVAEVREALKGVRVWGHPVPPLPGIAPLHLALHDAKGRNLVVEFVKGEIKVYDNPNGVLTNYPTFDWHLVNLQNYLTLSPVNAGSVPWYGSTLAPTGQGSGLFGIPGDWTPPSRFVRTTALLRFAKPAENALEGVNLAEHLLNAVDIPAGDIREKRDSSEGDYTQWVVVKDLTNRVFYFRSYRDLGLKFVDLKKVNFNLKLGSQPIPIEMGKGYQDVTSLLKSARTTVQGEITETPTLR